MTKRILVISWYFPPVNSSEGLVTCKLLNNSRFEYDVYTQKGNNAWAYNQTENFKVNKNINRIFSESTEFEDFYTDAILFYKKNISKYDIVMTRAMPEVDHKIGLKIKEINPNIIWIASFGDPIANNPYVIKAYDLKNIYSLKGNNVSIKAIFSIKRMLKSLVTRKRNNYIKKNIFNKNFELQKNIFLKCDYIIFNNLYQMKYMLKDYSRNEVLEQKCIILPHSYDESMYPAEDFKNDKIIFSYVGHLDDIRTPKLLFMALKDLKNENNDLSNKVHFNFYGNLSDNDKLYLINNDLLDLVSLKNSIDYIESLKVMKKSDWLIHIDANISDVLPYNIFFAAKIADYLGSKKPIFSVTMLDGASADILRECNELVVSFSKEDIKNYLYLIIYKNYKLNFSDDASYKYNAINVAKMLDELLFKIVK